MGLWYNSKLCFFNVSKSDGLKGGDFGSIIDGQDLVLHLITDNIYMDIKFTSRKSGKGGGYSHERTTDQSIATKEFNLLKMCRNEM
jgi:hypothetical protein